MATLTQQQLSDLVQSGALRKSHTSRTRGYVSRKTNNENALPYAGKFGKGYTVRHAAHDSSQYCWITYYVAA